MPCLGACSEKKDKSPLDPENPTTVTVWNYYNGEQLAAFETLVSRFNSTVGAEQGIIVVSASQGSINSLAAGLLDSVNGKLGAADVPSAAAVYMETAYILGSQNALVPLDSYFTADELAAYVPGFIDEGRLTEGGALLQLPVSKSTECFIVNATDWEPFAAATGITPESIKTYEDLTAAAAAYYAYTDGLTPDVSEDGKALYGRDSTANYLLVGARQLGHEIFRVTADGSVVLDLDRDTLRTLWDNYYVPFINGYFAANASFRSEDIKTGAVISMTGSTSGITYIPTAVTNADDVSHDITVDVMRQLCFAGGESVFVQQGAGYCILKTSETEQYATAEFLKWFTAEEQNLQFSVSSGYSPVKSAANDGDKLTAAFSVTSEKAQNVLNALVISADVFSKDTTYACRAFAGSKDARNILETALESTCDADRAAVKAQLAAGVTREEAVAPYLTDDYFNTWLENLRTQLSGVLS